VAREADDGYAATASYAEIGGDEITDIGFAGVPRRLAWLTGQRPRQSSTPPPRREPGERDDVRSPAARKVFKIFG
jgi:hypothetical protein